MFSFGATLPPSGSTDALEKALDAEIARIQADGVTEKEVERAKTQARARMLVGGGGRFGGGIQTALGRANSLSQNAVFFNDPGRVNTQLSRLDMVTAADVKRVANQYLKKDSRVILIANPEIDPGDPFGTPLAETAKEGK